MLSPDELKKQITDVLNHKDIIPDGRKGAFIVYADMGNNLGVTTAIAHRMGTNWEIQGDLGWHPHTDGLKAGVNLVGTW